MTMTNKNESWKSPWTSFLDRLGWKTPTPAEHGIAIPQATEEDKKWARSINAASIFREPLEVDLLDAVNDSNLWRVNHVLTLPRKRLFFWEKKIDPAVTISRGFFDLSALGLAAEKGAADIVKLLMHHGCDPNAPLTAGITPLHLAAWRGHKKTAAALIAGGARINTQAANDQTPLMLAAWNDYYALGEMLIALGAKTGQRTREGKTALHYAADANAVNFIRKMAALGADIDAKTKNGQTPLISAVNNNSLCAATALLELGADATLGQQGGWTIQNADEIHYTSFSPANGVCLTDIFDFAKEERTILARDTTAKTKVMLKEKFKDIAGSRALEEAGKQFKNLKAARRA